MRIPEDFEAQQLFQKLKAICVPLMGNTLLSKSSINIVSGLMSSLLAILETTRTQDLFLKPSLVQYIFTPLTTLLSRNKAEDIPDQILEKLLLILGALCESWWWFCEEQLWQQLFMLAGSVINDLGGKTKGKNRDDETKTAAALCLLSLLRPRTSEELERTMAVASAAERLDLLRERAQTPQFLPVLGQTLNGLLNAAESPHIPLQDAALDVIVPLISDYLPEDFVPSILPGTVSTTAKVALGTNVGRTWARGDAVFRSLSVMKVVIVKALGDEICVQAGAIRRVNGLEDLGDVSSETRADHNSIPSSQYATQRTPSWLRATATQLHMALNSLTPLTHHPHGRALRALADLSKTLLEVAALTLSYSRPLLLTFLLSISNSQYESVADEARYALEHLLSSSSERSGLLHALMQIARDALTSLPRLILSYSDSKVEHAANLVLAISRINSPEAVSSGGRSVSPRFIAESIGALLGPTGGIEKWGWSLLHALEITQPAATVTQASATQLLLGGGPAQVLATFPTIELKHLTSRSAQTTLADMFHALGFVAKDRCLFTIEWFISIGKSGRDNKSTSALWCACRLLEGAGGIRLDRDPSALLDSDNKKIRNLARDLARNIGEWWDQPGEIDVEAEEKLPENRDISEAHAIEYTSGLIRLHSPFLDSSPRLQPSKKPDQEMVHTVISLELLAVCAGVLQAKFANSLLFTIYPILRSIVSPVLFVSSAGFATLNFVATSCSYATPANLLLSNFDYALDAVSRRLTRRWLDVTATHVLCLLVRLVGRDVVHKAEDVVEACFDRLDEFHGYLAVVDGLVEVLDEIVRVVQVENSCSSTYSSKSRRHVDSRRIDELIDWFQHRQYVPETDTTDFGPAPREAWGRTDAQKEDSATADPVANEPETTPTQKMTKQIISRSLYLLTHGSPVVRSRILSLLSSSVAVLPQSSLLSSIHAAWPFILNRLSDSEPYVVVSAAVLIETLATSVGEFIYRRIWDDVWPRFRVMLGSLEKADSQSALARRSGNGAAVGTESIYTFSHRLHRALIRTMTAAARGVQAQDEPLWEVITSFRRFLHSQAHEELQECARMLYLALGENNADAVWLALESSLGHSDSSMHFLTSQWDISGNAAFVIRNMQESGQH